MPLAAAVPDQALDQGHDQDASRLVVAEAGLRAVRLIALPYVVLAAALAALLAAQTAWPANAWLTELRRSGFAALALAALLVALAGLAASWSLAWARRRAAQPQCPTPAGRRLLAWLRPGARGDALLVGRMARLPQALVVVPLAGLTLLCVFILSRLASALPGGGAVPPPDLCFALGGAAIVLAFPLLIGERSVASLPEVLLPEAPALRALLLLPVLVWPALGALEIATGLGVPFTDRLGRWLGLLVALLAAELAVRALLRLFLPPPPEAAARAAVHATLAGLLSAGLRGRAALAEPIRTHLGIDFARSWALAYIRRALPAVTLLLLAFCWGLSGVVMVGLDRRAVYERFGDPVAVLRPGAHLILPWPLGRLRWMDYGTLHEVPLGSADEAPGLPDHVAAEALPPPSADRMWESAHPAEVMLLIASERAGQQGFQSVSLDLRVLWRAGMSDDDALHLAYRSADPQALVRSAAGRATAQFFSARTLDDVLGENRAAMSDGLRAAMQRSSGCVLQRYRGGRSGDRGDPSAGRRRGCLPRRAGRRDRRQCQHLRRARPGAGRPRRLAADRHRAGGWRAGRCRRADRHGASRLDPLHRRPDGGRFGRRGVPAGALFRLAHRRPGQCAADHPGPSRRGRRCAGARHPPARLRSRARRRRGGGVVYWR